MIATIQTLLLLLTVLAAVALLSRRLNIAPSILLVIAGIALALIPGLPAIELAPEFVLLVILPPLIYSAGVSMSWREFRFSIGPIALLAFGCVIFTTCLVAVAVHFVLGRSWAIGFLIGAIVSPPDLVAPLAIARRLHLPRRLLVILEGEGLVNDATALVLYRFAVAAIATGMFSLAQASATFGLIVIGEIAYGIGIGWLSLRLRRWARDPRVEITMSLMTPYLAYWVPEHLGGSGVLATVAAGLYISWKGPLLISSATRLQGIFFWDFFIYLIEGFVFLLTGLQARLLLERISMSSLKELMLATALTVAIVIVARFVWVFPGSYLPYWLGGTVRRDFRPPWQRVFILAFTGVRGVVSLAAALAIPLTLANGQPFPDRDLILFITFGVIVVTLVGQGLMLPSVIRWLGVSNAGREEYMNERRAELAARREAAELARLRFEEIVAERGLPEDITTLLRSRYASRLELMMSSDTDNLDRVILRGNLREEVIAAERALIHRMLREGKITDEARRRIERELDLEEATIHTRAGDHGPL